MLQSPSSDTKTSFASWLPKTPEEDPIKSFGNISRFRRTCDSNKISARGSTRSLITRTGRTLNIDRLATPRYLESTKVRSRSKHVEIQTKHYEHRGSTPLASTNLIEVGKFLFTVDRERL